MPHEDTSETSLRAQWLTFGTVDLVWVGASIWLGAGSAPLLLRLVIFLIASVAFIILTARLARAVRRRKASYRH